MQTHLIGKELNRRKVAEPEQLREASLEALALLGFSRQASLDITDAFLQGMQAVKDVPSCPSASPK